MPRRASTSRARPPGERITLAPWLANVIVIAVLVVWLANFFAPFFFDWYRPDPQINFLFLGIAGGALGLKAVGGRGAPQGASEQPEEGEQ